MPRASRASRAARRAARIAHSRTSDAASDALRDDSFRRALDALKAGDDADYYAYAEALFFSRVRVAERATGVRLVCD